MHWSSAWMEIAVILHETASFVLKSMFLGKQSSLFQIKYSKLCPNKSLNAVQYSASTRAKSGLQLFLPKLPAVELNGKTLGWDHSWLFMPMYRPATHILLNTK